MEQHPLPRQITSFEFKLIGFMTLHQFIYLLVFVPMGFAVYKIVPVPFVNVFLGFIIASAGVLLAFLPVNDRPLDVFIKNLYKRLSSPTQYLYSKSNQTMAFLNPDHPLTDQDRARHTDSQEKLSKYLQQKKSNTDLADSVGIVSADIKKALEEPVKEIAATKLPSSILSNTVAEPEQKNKERQPFFVGVVKNNKEKPLPEILVYVKDQTNVPVRLLKTNPNGVFATYSSLPKGEYLIEAKDPRGSHLFDALKIHLGDSNPTPFTMLSKGVL